MQSDPDGQTFAHLLIGIDHNHRHHVPMIVATATVTVVDMPSIEWCARVAHINWNIRSG